MAELAAAAGAPALTGAAALATLGSTPAVADKLAISAALGTLRWVEISTLPGR